MAPDRLRSEIRQAFSDRFGQVTDLLAEWYPARANPEAFVILACSAIDALANLGQTRGSQASRFTSFVERYSGKEAEGGQIWAGIDRGRLNGRCTCGSTDGWRAYGDRFGHDDGISLATRVHGFYARHSPVLVVDGLSACNDPTLVRQLS